MAILEDPPVPPVPAPAVTATTLYAVGRYAKINNDADLPLYKIEEKDASGYLFENKSLPLLLSHDPERCIGRAVGGRREGNSLVCCAVISDSGFLDTLDLTAKRCQKDGDNCDATTIVQRCFPQLSAGSVNGVITEVSLVPIGKRLGTPVVYFASSDEALATFSDNPAHRTAAQQVMNKALSDRRPPPGGEEITNVLVGLLASQLRYKKNMFADPSRNGKIVKDFKDINAHSRLFAEELESDINAASTSGDEEEDGVMDQAMDDDETTRIRRKVVAGVGGVNNRASGGLVSSQPVPPPAPMTPYAPAPADWSGYSYPTTSGGNPAFWSSAPSTTNRWSGPPVQSAPQSQSQLQTAMVASQEQIAHVVNQLFIAHEEAKRLERERVARKETKQKREEERDKRERERDAAVHRLTELAENMSRRSAQERDANEPNEELPPPAKRMKMDSLRGGGSRAVTTQQPQQPRLPAVEESADDALMQNFFRSFVAYTMKQQQQQQQAAAPTAATTFVAPAATPAAAQEIQSSSTSSSSGPLAALMTQHLQQQQQMQQQLQHRNLATATLQASGDMADEEGDTTITSPQKLIETLTRNQEFLNKLVSQ